MERHSVRKRCRRRTHTAAIPLADLTAVGVTTFAIPRTGKPSAARARIEPADDFVDTVKWRTGCEGRVSHLERDWAWRGTPRPGPPRAPPQGRPPRRSRQRPPHGPTRGRGAPPPGGWGPLIKRRAAPRGRGPG